MHAAAPRHAHRPTALIVRSGPAPAPVNGAVAEAKHLKSVRHFAGPTVGACSFLRVGSVADARVSVARLLAQADPVPPTTRPERKASLAAGRPSARPACERQPVSGNDAIRRSLLLRDPREPLPPLLHRRAQCMDLSRDPHAADWVAAHFLQRPQWQDKVDAQARAELIELLRHQCRVAPDPQDLAVHSDLRAMGVAAAARESSAMALVQALHGQCADWPVHALRSAVATVGMAILAAAPADTDDLLRALVLRPQDLRWTALAMGGLSQACDTGRLALRLSSLFFHQKRLPMPPARVAALVAAAIGFGAGQTAPHACETNNDVSALWYAGLLIGAQPSMALMPERLVKAGCDWLQPPAPGECSMLRERFLAHQGELFAAATVLQVEPGKVFSRELPAWVASLAGTPQRTSEMLALLEAYAPEVTRSAFQEGARAVRSSSPVQWHGNHRPA